MKKENKISGNFYPSGSKNSALPIIAASLLTKSCVTLKNVPEIEDIFTMIRIINYLNCKTNFVNNTLNIDCRNIRYRKLLIEDISKIRASYYLLGSLIGMNKTVEMRWMGGCSFSKRPIDQHILAFEKLGIKTEIKDNIIKMKRKKTRCNDIVFQKKSFGATINAVLASVQISRNVKIYNIPSDPELYDFLGYVSQYICNADIINNCLSFSEKKDTGNSIFYIMNDRIEIESFILLGASLGKINIYNLNINIHKEILDLLKKSGVYVNYYNDVLSIEKREICENRMIIFDYYPQLATDIGVILCAFYIISGNKRMMMFQDNIYPERLKKITEFVKPTKFINGKLIVNCNNTSITHDLIATNLRDGMAYLILALGANHECSVYGLNHLNRGYENIVEKINKLGGNICIENLK